MFWRKWGMGTFLGVGIFSRGYGTVKNIYYSKVRPPNKPKLYVAACRVMNSIVYMYVWACS